MINHNNDSKNKRITSNIKDAVLTGLVTYIMCGPITGIVLDGYATQYKPLRPLILAVVIALLRFGQLFYLNRKLKYVDFFSNAWSSKLGFFNHLTDKKLANNKIVIALTITLGFLLPFVVGKYWLTVIILAYIYVLLGLGLNIVVGLAGLLDLGFVAFYAVGAYGYGLGSQYLGLSFWEAMVGASLLAALFGVILGFPVLKMHGDYLAIVTLGFGEIIRLVLNNWVSFTGGPNGIRVPFPTVFGLEFTRRAKQGGVPFHEFFNLEYSTEYRYIFLYLVLFVVCGGMIFAINRIKHLPIGRSWEALREDEIACRSLGINHVNVKLSAFCIGAMVGGIAGVFFASLQGFINPTSFTFFESALILSIIVLGGLGSTMGVVVAALVLTILPEVLRDFSDYRVLIFGLLMVLIMIWKPRGLFQAKRPQYTYQGTSNI